MNEISRALDDIERALRAAPRYIDGVRRFANAGRSVADALEPAFRAYQDTHGGRAPRGRGVHRVAAPDAEGGTLVELGSLAAVAYLTSKDRRRQAADLYIHDFEAPLPSLCFREGSRELVIVRGFYDEGLLRRGSRYTVDKEGIEG